MRRYIGEAAAIALAFSRLASAIEIEGVNHEAEARQDGAEQYALPESLPSKRMASMHQAPTQRVVVRIEMPERFERIVKKTSNKMLTS